MQEMPRNQMEEALMKATMRHPDSFLADITKIGPAWDEFHTFGRATLESFRSSANVNPELVEAWKGMRSQLSLFDDESQILLIRRLGEGIGISEENHDPFYNSVFDDIKNNRSLSKPIFTPSAILFRTVISMLSASKVESKALSDYIKKKSRPMRVVSLPMIYRPIANWLCENQLQSASTPPLDNH